MKHLFARRADSVLATASAATPWHPGAEECTPDTTRIEVRQHRRAHDRAAPEPLHRLRGEPALSVGRASAGNAHRYGRRGRSRSSRIWSGLVGLVLERAGVSKFAAARGAHAWSPGPSRRRQAFSRLPDAEIAPIESAALREFFGFNDWPNGLATDRPRWSHHRPDPHARPSRGSHRLLRPQYADCCYGRFPAAGTVVSQDLDAYHASAQRVADFVKAHPVEQVLGAHIELDVTGNPYPGGATFHPNESAAAAHDAGRA